MTVNDTRRANGLAPADSGRTTPAAAAIDGDDPGEAAVDGRGEKMAHMGFGSQSIVVPPVLAGAVLPRSMYRRIDLRFWLAAGVLGLAAWGLLFYLA